MDELRRHEHDEELVCKVCLMSGQDWGHTAALNEVREGVENKQKAFRKIEYDGNKLESASAAYHCHFETWNEVIRYEQGVEETFTAVLALLTNLEKGK